MKREIDFYTGFEGGHEIIMVNSDEAHLAFADFVRLTIDSNGKLLFYYD